MYLLTCTVLLSYMCCTNEPRKYLFTLAMLSLCSFIVFLLVQEKVDTLTERLESLQSGKTPTSDATTPSMDQPDSSSKLSVKSKGIKL